MKRIDGEVIAAILVFAVVLIALGSIIYTAVKNEENRITEGIIIDKEISMGGTSARMSKNGGRVYSYPTTYYFKLQGQKDEGTVEYWMIVTAEEYDTFKTGEYYRK